MTVQLSPTAKGPKWMHPSGIIFDPGADVRESSESHKRLKKFWETLDELKEWKMVCIIQTLYPIRSIVDVIIWVTSWWKILCLWLVFQGSSFYRNLVKIDRPGVIGWFVKDVMFHLHMIHCGSAHYRKSVIPEITSDAKTKVKPKKKIQICFQVIQIDLFSVFICGFHSFRTLLSHVTLRYIKIRSFDHVPWSGTSIPKNPLSITIPPDTNICIILIIWKSMPCTQKTVRI